MVVMIDRQTDRCNKKKICERKVEERKTKHIGGDKHQYTMNVLILFLKINIFFLALDFAFNILLMGRRFLSCLLPLHPKILFLRMDLVAQLIPALGKQRKI